MSDPLADLSRFATDLKRAAPNEFLRFVAAMKLVDESATKTLRSAQPDVILNAQGRANMIAEVLAKLENCKP